MEQTVINPVDPPSERLPAMFYKAGDPIHSLADLIIRVLSALFIPCIHETADRPFSPIFFLHKQDRGQTGHAPVHTCKYKKPHSHIEQLLCHRRKVTLDPAERRIRCETSADRTPCSLRAAQPVSGKICPHKQHQTKRRPEDLPIPDPQAFIQCDHKCRRSDEKHQSPFQHDIGTVIRKSDRIHPCIIGIIRHIRVQIFLRDRKNCRHI